MKSSRGVNASASAAADGVSVVEDDAGIEGFPAGYGGAARTDRDGGAASTTGGASSIPDGAPARRRPRGEAAVSGARALPPTSRRGGTIDGFRGSGGSFSLGMAGNSLPFLPDEGLFGVGGRAG